jgi:hypothetical protein
VGLFEEEDWLGQGCHPEELRRGVMKLVQGEILLDLGIPLLTKLSLVKLDILT